MMRKRNRQIQGPGTSTSGGNMVQNKGHHHAPKRDSSFPDVTKEHIDGAKELPRDAVQYRQSWLFPETNSASIFLVSKMCFVNKTTSPPMIIKVSLGFYPYGLRGGWSIRISFYHPNHIYSLFVLIYLQMFYPKINYICLFKLKK